MLREIIRWDGYTKRNKASNAGFSNSNLDFFWSSEMGACFYGDETSRDLYIDIDVTNFSSIVMNAAFLAPAQTLGLGLVKRVLTMVHSGNDDMGILFNNGKIQVRSDDLTNVSNIIGTQDATDNVRHLATLVYNGTELIGYIDGIEFGRQTIPFDFSTASGRFFIGSFNFLTGSSNQYIRGLIPYVDVYEGVPTQQDLDGFMHKFLSLKPLSIQKSNFYYPKPQENLEATAAYNMIPIGGKLIDISNNGNDGTIVGPLPTVDGLVFDGIDDYVDCGIQDNLGAGDFTIAVYIKSNINTLTGFYGRTKLAGQQGRLALYISPTTNGYRALLEAAGSVVYTLDGSAATPGRDLTIILRRTGTLIELFEDGEQIAFAFVAAGADFSSNTLSFRMGSFDDAGNNPANFLDGEIYDVSTYNFSQPDSFITKYDTEQRKNIKFFDDIRFEKLGLGLPEERLYVQGDFEIIEESDGTRMVQSNSNSATVAIPIKSSDTDVSIDFIHARSADSQFLRFSENANPPGPLRRTGYSNYIATDGTLTGRYLNASINGVAQWTTAAGFINQSEKYTFRNTRIGTENTCYVNGEIVSAAGNPYSNSVLTDSSFILFIMNTGDKVGNVLVK